MWWAWPAAVCCVSSRRHDCSWIVPQSWIVFIPKYTPVNEFKTLPWGVDDVTEFISPVGVEREYCSIMLRELIDWIIAYEEDTLAILGMDYRMAILDLWDNGKRRVFSPQNSIKEWTKLRDEIEEILVVEDL